MLVGEECGERQGWSGDGEGPSPASVRGGVGAPRGGEAPPREACAPPHTPACSGGPRCPGPQGKEDPSGCR